MKSSISELIEVIKEELMLEITRDLISIVEERMKPKKAFYSLKEVSFITGLSVHAIKGRYRRKTLKVSYEGGTPLIPADEVDRILQKLKIQN
jgi:hypothetical protein